LMITHFPIKRSYGSFDFDLPTKAKNGGPNCK